MPQGTNERLGAPVPEWGVINQTLSARRPASGLDRGFVDEGQSFQMPGHEGLAPGDPYAAQVGHIPALLFKRPGLALEPHHIVDEFYRNANPPGCFGVRVSLLHECDGAVP